MAVNIFTKNFMDNLEQLDLKTKFGIAINICYLINDKIGACYEYIERQNIWNYRKVWTCKMRVVWIVLKLLLNLVVEQIISKRILIENSTANTTEDKVKYPMYNSGQLSNEF